MPQGVEEIKGIKESVENGNFLGIVVGVLGLAFIGFTIYSISLSVKVSKLNIKKLNSEGFH